MIPAWLVTLPIVEFVTADEDAAAAAVLVIVAVTVDMSNVVDVAHDNFRGLRCVRCVRCVIEVVYAVR